MKVNRLTYGAAEQLLKVIAALVCVNIFIQFALILTTKLEAAQFVYTGSIPLGFALFGLATWPSERNNPWARMFLVIPTLIGVLYSCFFLWNLEGSKPWPGLISTLFFLAAAVVIEPLARRAQERYEAQSESSFEPGGYWG